MTSSHIGVNILNFCSEMPSDDKSAGNLFSVTALEQLTYDKESSKDKFALLMHKVGGGHNAQEKVMSSDDMTVHDYGSCGQFEFLADNVVKKDTVVRYKEKIENEFGQFFPHKTV